MKNKVAFDAISSTFAQSLSTYLSSDMDICVGVSGSDANVTRAVFDVGLRDEGGLVDAILEGTVSPEDMAQDLHQDLEMMMEQCRQLLSLATSQVQQFQIWVLSIDDVAARQHGLAETPIVNQARLSCVKALAKEYGRMGVAVNACFVHPTREMLSSEQIKKSRSTMKPFVLRYKPELTHIIAETLGNLMRQEILPMNGSALYLTNGGVEVSS